VSGVLWTNRRLICDKYLPQLASAIRSSVNRMTGMVPNQMMLGREICLPTDLVFRPLKEDNIEDEHEYVTMLKETIRKTHEFARKKIQANQEYMKKDYDLNVRKMNRRQKIMFIFWTRSLEKGETRS
jgi:hypothetical protein